MPADVAVDFGHVNTEVCEQWHASVDMLTRHVASMSQFNFMLTLQVVDCIVLSKK
jgi:hypothetical protein